MRSLKRHQPTSSLPADLPKALTTEIFPEALHKLLDIIYLAKENTNSFCSNAVNSLSGHGELFEILRDGLAAGKPSASFRNKVVALELAALVNATCEGQFPRGDSTASFSKWTLRVVGIDVDPGGAINFSWDNALFQSLQVAADTC